jgi:hypothetical protein
MNRKNHPNQLMLRLMLLLMLVVLFLVESTTLFANPRMLSLQPMQLLGNNSRAQHPLTIDPRFQQQAYLKASNTEFGDKFGLSIAIDNNTLVVGATGESSDATGINDDQENNLKRGSGAAYIFTKRGNNWVQQAYLKASNTSTGDSFGRSVGIHGQTLVVGAPFEDSNATVVNGDQDNTEALNSGAVYVFTRNGDSWSQQAYLKASNTDAYDFFGFSVAIDNNTIVVGSAGAAYVFIQRNSSWIQQAYLQAPVAVLQSEFGKIVAISDNTIVIGATSFGEINSSAGSRQGAAFVYIRQNGVWNQQAILTASNAHGSAQFGNSVAISGDSIVVGARFEDNNGSNVRSSRDASGAAYVFTRNNGIWKQQSRLQATNTEAEDRFGGKVAIVDNTIVIGANGEDSSSIGINPDPADNGSNASGAAYVFTRNNGIWNQQAYMKASNTEQFDLFGSSLALTRDTVVVGTHFEDSNATGSNGDQTNNEASNAGAVYVFDLLSTDTKAGSTVSGFVWLDNNGDGLFSDGEPPFTQSIPDFGGLVLALFSEDSQEPIDVFYLNTNSTGRYAFYDVPAGRYFVCTNTVFLQLGLSVTTQNAGDDTIDSDFDDTPCASDIIISDTRSARLDLGLVGNTQDQPDNPIDTGNLTSLTVNTDSLLINHQWRPTKNIVNAANSVIFYSAPSSNGGQRGITRMRRKNNRIEFKFQEWSNLDGVHVNEVINLVSFPQGNWQDGNTQIEVGTTTISGTKQWKTIHFNNTFSTPPTVILSLQTAIGGDAVDVHVRNITTDSMQIALFEEERKMNSGHITETVGFLLVASDNAGFDLGNPTSTRIDLPFRTTGIALNHNWKNIGSGVHIRLEEDQTKDQETAHVNETVHVLKINTVYLTQIASANGGDPSVLRSRDQ